MRTLDSVTFKLFERLPVYGREELVMFVEVNDPHTTPRVRVHVCAYMHNWSAKYEEDQPHEPWLKALIEVGDRLMAEFNKPLTFTSL
jgi:hypothetical protein